LAFNIGLAVAGPIFAAVLIVGLSIALDELLLGGSLVGKLQPVTETSSIVAISAPLFIGLIIVGVIGVLASTS
jgi:hypothetical protein